MTATVDPERSGRLIRPESDGTLERRWRGALASLPSVLDHRPSLLGERVVVVAPHPDDESLGAGGLISMACRAGGDVRLVVCTDGEAASDDPELGTRRGSELARAVDRLRDGRPLPISRLQLPDGALREHADELDARLRGPITGADVVVVPWTGDGHPDHEAAGLVAASIAAESDVAVLEYPVWAWHWAEPAELVSTNRLVNLALDETARWAKRSAISCHASQLHPRSGPAVLTAAVLEHFRRPHETFVVR